tara:strand:+ start:577 stop:1194 length:618 start_codon:yes stop_codon:yes gene_type:complete
MLERPSWGEWFMGLAMYAATRSKDPTTKCGAVLVGVRNSQVALGYNGFPPEVIDRISRLEARTLRLRYTQHAERNVLDNAAFDTQDSTMYSTLFPCQECAKSLITKQVALVVAPQYNWGEERWGTHPKETEAMLREAGVAYFAMPLQFDLFTVDGLRPPPQSRIGDRLLPPEDKHSPHPEQVRGKSSDSEAQLRGGDVGGDAPSD